MVAVHNGSDVNIHDVAIAQNLVGAGNAVTNHFVDAGADRFRERIDGTGITQGRTLCPVFLGPCLGGIVEF